MELGTIIDSQEAECRIAKPQRFIEHRVEDGREVAERGVNNPQYLGGRGLPLQRFGKFSFTFGKFSFTLGKATPQIGYQLFGVG